MEKQFNFPKVLSTKRKREEPEFQLGVLVGSSALGLVPLILLLSAICVPERDDKQHRNSQGFRNSTFCTENMFKKE